MFRLHQCFVKQQTWRETNRKVIKWRSVSSDLSALSLQTAVLLQVQADQRQGPNPSGGGRPWGRGRPGRASLLFCRWEQSPGYKERRSTAERFALWSQGAPLWNLHCAVIPGTKLSGGLSSSWKARPKCEKFPLTGAPWSFLVNIKKGMFTFSVTQQNTVRSSSCFLNPGSFTSTLTSLHHIMARGVKLHREPLTVFSSSSPRGCWCFHWVSSSSSVALTHSSCLNHSEATTETNSPFLQTVTLQIHRK